MTQYISNNRSIFTNKFLEDAQSERASYTRGLHDESLQPANELQDNSGQDALQARQNLNQLENGETYPQDTSGDESILDEYGYNKLMSEIEEEEEMSTEEVTDPMDVDSEEPTNEEPVETEPVEEDGEAMAGDVPSEAEIDQEINAQSDTIDEEAPSEEDSDEDNGKTKNTEPKEHKQGKDIYESDGEVYLDMNQMNEGSRSKISAETLKLIPGKEDRVKIKIDADGKYSIDIKHKNEDGKIVHHKFEVDPAITKIFIDTELKNIDVKINKFHATKTDKQDFLFTLQSNSEYQGFLENIILGDGNVSENEDGEIQLDTRNNLLNQIQEDRYGKKYNYTRNVKANPKLKQDILDFIENYTAFESTKKFDPIAAKERAKKIVEILYPEEQTSIWETWGNMGKLSFLDAMNVNENDESSDDALAVFLEAVETFDPNYLSDILHTYEGVGIMNTFIGCKNSYLFMGEDDSRKARMDNFIATSIDKAGNPISGGYND